MSPTQFKQDEVLIQSPTDLKILTVKNGGNEKRKAEDNINESYKGDTA